jgi:hypothetical protein
LVLRGDDLQSGCASNTSERKQELAREGGKKVTRFHSSGIIERAGHSQCSGETKRAPSAPPAAKGRGPESRAAMDLIAKAAHETSDSYCAGHGL